MFYNLVPRISRKGDQPVAVRIENATLMSGEILEFAQGVTVVVGPNNVGKSLVLNEINQEINSHPNQQSGYPFKAVDDLSLVHTLDGDGLIDWLGTTYDRRDPGRYPDGYFQEPSFRSGSGTAVQESQARQLWNSTKLGPLGGLLVRHLSPDGRTGLTNNSGAMNLLQDKPSDPLQHLYADRDLERAASDAMMRAFGLSLTINRYAGSQITLHVGRTESKEEMPPSKQYLEELARLPFLQEQGDGIRAFMGILLMITTTHYPIVLIDEPEAFLHPPQARLLGQVLAEQHSRGTQVIVATHSADFLQGVTASKAAAGNVTIARLTRSAAGNHVAQVSTRTVRELYEDPLVQYYRILDGLFYHGVVLGEGDSDCTYYRAVLDTVESLDDGTPTESVSIHFTHCGGKARLRKAVDALRSAKVPFACVVDFDILQNKEEFEALVSACGGDVATLAPLRNDIASVIDTKATRVERLVAKTKIDSVISARSTDYLNGSEITKVQDAVRTRSGWREAKKQGRSLLSGQAVTSFDRLNAALRTLGIFVTEKGELERFHPEVPADNKAEWLRKVLEQKLFASSADAQGFIKDIAASILARQ
jgi:hypothetical protein